MTDSVLLLLMLLLHMLSSLWANARPLPDWSPELCWALSRPALIWKN
jgi:hypothetical protein